MYYTYILEGRGGGHACGSTHNLKRSVMEHTHGLVPSTKDGAPWRLIWFCAFRSYEKSLAFEQFITSDTGKEFARAHLL